VVATSTRESVSGSRRTRLGTWLFFIGIPVIVLALHQLHARVVAVPSYELSTSSQFGWDALFAALIVVAAYSLGLPEGPRNLWSAMLRSGIAGVIGALSISFIQLLLASRILPRFTVFATVIVLIPWGAFCNWLVGGRAFGAPKGMRVLVVAQPADLSFLDVDLARDLERPVTLVGRVTMAEAGATPNALIDVSKNVAPGLIVLSSTAQEVPRIIEQVGELHESGVRVRSLRAFYEQWMGKMPTGELERSSLMFDVGEVHQPGYARVKRAIDVLGASLLLIPLAVLLPLVWVGNVLGNRGPMFYSQPRVGKNDEIFQIFKFRSMAPGSGPSEWTTEKDPRVTPFGRILRASHLDELPQVLNVFKGDLSLVGPRPEQPAYVEELSQKLPYYHLRHMVRPGITGWAQVKYPYGASEQDALEKLQFEFYYLRHQSFGLDTRILGRTLRTVFAGSGR
jgi:lipopolysaccharide/colanic/teichoic acid biosynthesis glycosyltransferase